MLELKRIIRQFHGSSFPVEVETVDGPNYVMKMRGSGNGSASLVQEFIVNSVASGAGWPVPTVAPIRIREEFPWEFGTDEFDDLLQRSYGVNLGIAPIKGLSPVAARELKELPPEFLARIAAIDAFFCNFDRTLRAANIERDSGGGLWIIDHGSCQLLDLVRGDRAVTLAPNHFLKPEETTLLRHPAIRELANTARLEEAVAKAPEDWLAAVKVTRPALLGALVRRSQSL